MIVLMQDDIVWEYDFINFDILLNKYKISTFRANKWPSRADIIIFNHKFKNSLAYVKKHNPRVIFYMSDEQSGYPSVADYALYTNLFIHCYNHDYAYLDNSIQMPLGYVTGFLGGKSVFNINQKPISERATIAAFVGDGVKNDRPLMIKKMKELGSGRHESSIKFIETQNNWKLDAQKIAPKDIWGIYNDSIFVPIGRGYYSLDCFRIYEAIAAGAIPVIVGSESEISISFKFNGCRLPALYFDNWEAAASGCAKLLSELGNLQEMQDNLVLWFKNRIEKIRNLIAESINEPVVVAVANGCQSKKSKFSGGTSYIAGICDNIFDMSLTIIILLYYIYRFCFDGHVGSVDWQPHRHCRCDKQICGQTVDYIFR